MKHRILVVGQDQPLWHEFAASVAESDCSWAVEYARSGPEALACLDGNSFAAAIADVQLSDMNGLDLLDEVMRRQPKTLRFVLSDVADTLGTIKCVGRAHQHLMKPCDGSTLLRAVTQGLAREKWLPSDSLQSLLAQMRLVPSPPLLYFQVAAELQTPDASVERVSDLISKDPAITSKVLQLANSALFGLQLQVTQPIEAIAYIGLETTKALVLMAHTFSSFERVRMKDFSAETLWRHSVVTGQCAKRIAQLERDEPDLAEEAFSAGLLHDMGKLMFAANMPGLFTEALELAREQKRNFWEVESQVLGACHAELGACLLGIWGLPQSLVEAVALHHFPLRSNQPNFNSLTAVHVANVLEHEQHMESSAMTETLDLNYLRELGMEDRIEEWRGAVPVH